MLSINIKSGVIYCFKSTVNGHAFQFNEIYSGDINDTYEVAGSQSELVADMTKSQSLLVPNKVTSLTQIDSFPTSSGDSRWKKYLNNSIRSKQCFGIAIKAKCSKRWSLDGNEDVNGNIVGKLNCRVDQNIDTTVSFTNVMKSYADVDKLQFFWTDTQFCITNGEPTSLIQEWIDNNHPNHLIIPNFKTPDSLSRTGQGKFAYKTSAPTTVGSSMQLKVGFTYYGTRTYILPGYIPGTTQFDVPNEDPDLTGPSVVEFPIHYDASTENGSSPSGIYKFYEYTPGSYNKDNDTPDYDTINETFVKC